MNTPTRAALLVTRLADATDLWLIIECGFGCKGDTGYPIKLLARERGGELLIGAVLTRFRCKRCRRRPASVWATDDPAAGAYGGRPPTWRVELLP